MGPKHTRDEILGGALEEALAEGLSRLSFGRVAARMGTSDRVVVYYFPSKTELVGAVLALLAAELQSTLAPAFARPAPDHLGLVRAAWPLLSRPDADAVFALFFEANGLAAIGREPYAELVPQFVGMWIDWAAERLTGSSRRRRTEAEAAIALLDGLLLLRQVAGGDAADRAARRLGVRR